MEPNEDEFEAMRAKIHEIDQRLQEVIRNESSVRPSIVHSVLELIQGNIRDVKFHASGYDAAIEAIGNVRVPASFEDTASGFRFITQAFVLPPELLSATCTKVSEEDKKAEKKAYNSGKTSVVKPVKVRANSENFVPESVFKSIRFEPVSKIGDCSNQMLVTSFFQQPRSILKTPKNASSANSESLKMTQSNLGKNSQDCHFSAFRSTAEPLADTNSYNQDPVLLHTRTNSAWIEGLSEANSPLNNLNNVYTNVQLRHTSIVTETQLIKNHSSSKFPTLNPSVARKLESFALKIDKKLNSENFAPEKSSKTFVFPSKPNVTQNNKSGGQSSASSMQSFKRSNFYHSNLIAITNDYGLIANQSIDESKLRIIIGAIKTAPRHLKTVELAKNTFKVNPSQILRKNIEERLPFELLLNWKNNKIECNSEFKQRDLDSLALVNVLVTFD